MMKVIPVTAAVTRYDGEAISLVRDKEHDLPDDLAQRLITAGLVVAVESEDEKAERIAAEEKAEAERIAAEEKAEAERIAAEKAKAASGQSPKKGAQSSKKLDGAPENK